MAEITSTIGKVGQTTSAPDPEEQRQAERVVASIPHTPQALQEQSDQALEMSPHSDAAANPMPLPDLKSLIELGRVRDSILIGKIRFEMETLDDEAQREIFRRVSNDAVDGADSFVRLRRLTVAVATMRVNDQPFEDLMPGAGDALDRKIQIISRMQDSVVDRLFEFYNELVERSQKDIAPGQVKN